MNPLWWVGIALLLVVIEIISLDLVLIMFAGGALSAGLTGYLGGPMWAQVLVFAVVSLLLLAALRPWLLRSLRGRVRLEETGTAALVGKEAQVVAEVGATTGRVKLVGEVWTARTSAAEPLAPGTRVRVVAIEGATAVVEPEHVG